MELEPRPLESRLTYIRGFTFGGLVRAEDIDAEYRDTLLNDAQPKPNATIPIERLKKNSSVLRSKSDQFKVFDNGSEIIIYNSLNLEVSHEYYRKINPDKTHIFDVYHRGLHSYDPEGRLLRYSEMQVGRIGFVERLIYTEEKELIRVEIQDYTKDAFLNPDQPVGKVDTIVF